MRLFEDIARQINEIRVEAKAQQPPDLVLDKTVKELVNSVYGKIAQSVAGMRIIQDDRVSVASSTPSTARPTGWVRAPSPTP